MAQTSWPFENADTTEVQYSALFAKLQTTGVDGDQSGTVLKVSANTGMAVNVAAGFAIIRGFAYQSTDVEPLTLQAGETQPRIDIIVLRLDPTANSIVLAIKKGTAAASPSAPALTQTAGSVWEMPLAQIAVAANATAIGGGDITDTRRFLGSQVGTWTTATRPGSPTLGLLGYNSSLSAYEFWNGSAWAGIPVTLADGSVTDAKLAVPPRRYVAVEVNATTALTLTTASAGKIIRATNGGGLAVTVNSGSLAEGDRVDFVQASTAPVTFIPGFDVTLLSKDTKRKTNGTWSAVSLVKVNDGQYLLVGDLSA